MLVSVWLGGEFLTGEREVEIFKSTPEVSLQLAGRDVAIRDMLHSPVIFIIWGYGYGQHPLSLKGRVSNRFPL